MFKKYIDLYKKIVIPLYYNLYKMDNQQQNNNYKGKIFQKEIIEDYIKGDSLVILSNKYDYNISTIRYYLIKNNISIRSVKQSVKKFQKNKEIIDNNNLHENIIGWILGDGGVRLHKNGTTPFFNYTDKKYDHIKYVENILNSNNIKTNITKNNNTNCYQLQTESLKYFQTYYDLFYNYEGLNENNQKRKILPNIILTKTILKNWYIGDGSSSKQSGTLNHKATICCKHYNENIYNQLDSLFGIKCYKFKTKTGYCHHYHFNNLALKKLLDYIGDCPVEGYKYKWIVRCSETIIEPSL